VYAVCWRSSYTQGHTDGSHSFSSGLEFEVQADLSDTGKLESWLDMFLHIDSQSRFSRCSPPLLS
jgi:hypothetical protein